MPILPVTLAERTAVARQSLKTEAKKLARLLEKLAADKQRADEAVVLREQAEVLKTFLAKIPRGAARFEAAVPWQPERILQVPLRPDLGPVENVQRLFQRARGLERGAAIIAGRIDEVEMRALHVQELQQQWQGLLHRAEAWQRAFTAGESPADRPRVLLALADTWLQEVQQLRLKIGGEDKPSQAQRQIARAKQAELPKGVELFESPAGHPVLAGRNATANDALVVRYLRGRDWWFHARDQAGAHVVLRWQGKETPPESELAACAVLAAHLSGLDKGSRVEVIACPGKGVRKVKGAAPGAVYVSGERAVRVEVDAATVDAFYARRPPR